MTKMYIDYEWSVEVPILKEDGSYLKKQELEVLNIDVTLQKMINLWSFAIQNAFNWHNPDDNNNYLPDYYYSFINRLEDEIIGKLKDFDIELVKK